MHTSSNVAAILLIIGAMSAADARADLVAFDFSGSLHNVSGYATNQDFGFEFSPITDLRVTTLLVWDSGGDDFGTFDADVAIWDVANPSAPVVAGSITTAGSPTQPSASPSLGVWRVVDVPDTILTGGATYRLAADGFLDSDYGRATNLTLLLNGITLSSPNPGVQSLPESSWAPGPEYPNEVDPAIWATASFTYTAVPEPGAFWLVGLVCVGAKVGQFLRRPSRF
ncbi:MAG: hypothetical protein KDA61_01690 [Planctomycetales bacterium]|nr:hypothetical protein [Planctomycetales bacterium]